MPVSRYFASIAAILAGLSVAAGAFGAHALRARLEADLLPVFETAARYQMYHAIGLFVCAWLISTGPSLWAERAGWAFIIGTVLFSGSLYALALTGVRVLGAVTPFGGVAFLAGWVMLAIAARPR